MGFGNSAFSNAKMQIDGVTLAESIVTGKVGVTVEEIVDGITILAFNNKSIIGTSKTNSIPSSDNVTISTNKTLTSDIFCNNFTVNSGVTLTTNGFNIYCTGVFTNNGTINTGAIANTGGAGGTGYVVNGSPGGNSAYGLYIQANQIIAGVINSNGAAGTAGTEDAGSGGGGGGGSILLAYGSGGYTAGTYTTTGGAGGSYFAPAGSIASSTSGGSGGGTTVAGGSGGDANVGNPGASATAPTITNTLIDSWYSSGMSNYLNGGGGGGGGATSISGQPSTNGGNGKGYASSYGGSGGGGSGANQNMTLYGGNGGNGLVMTYNWSSAPVAISTLVMTSIQSGINNVLQVYSTSAQTNATTTPAIAYQSFNFTPTKSGNLVIRFSVLVSNNTAGDGVAIMLYRGTTQLETISYTSVSAGQQGTVTLAVPDVGLTVNQSESYSVQFNAVTGGTASLTLTEFEIQEVY